MADENKPTLLPFFHTLILLLVCIINITLTQNFEVLRPKIDKETSSQFYYGSLGQKLLKGENIIKGYENRNF